MDLICRFFFFIQLLLLSGISLSGQTNIRFENFSVEDGLPSNYVSCIYQDNSGWIWLGTNHGLCKFDGHSFKTYLLVNAETGGESSDVNCLYEDREGRLWIGTTDAGLGLYNSEMDKFSYFSNTGTCSNCISSNKVNSLTSDKTGKLLVATDNGLDIFDPETEDFQAIRRNNLLPATISHNTVKKIFVDSEGLYWLGTANGLDTYDPVTGRIENFELKASKKLHKNDPYDILEIYEDSEGNIRIGTYSSGILIINKKTDTVTSLIPDPDNRRSYTIRAMYEDDQGNIWVGTRGGLYIFDRNNHLIAHHVNTKHDLNSLSHNSIHDIFEDKVGDLWISTREGFSHISKSTQAFKYYGSEVDNRGFLNNEEVYAILETEEGMIWLGTESGGVNILDPETGKFEYMMHDEKNPNSISSNCIKSLIQDREGNFWIGTFLGGLNYYDKLKKQFIHFENDPDNSNSLSDNKVWSILEDSKGNIWIGTGKGLDRYDPASNSFEHYNDIVHDSPVYTIFEDNSGNTFIATAKKGLFILTSDLQIREYDISTRVIFEDSKNRIWIGSNAYKGLFRFDIDSGIQETYTTLDGLPSNKIHGILEDDNGKLWISTPLGLSMFDPDTIHMHNYELADGKQGNRFNYGAYCKSSSGELYFGGQNGLCSFFPDKIIKNENIPPVFITKLKIFNKEVPIDAEFHGKKILEKSVSASDEITIDYDHSVLTFEFVALNYNNSAKNQYSYKLEGFDRRWNNVNSDRSATYTNLDPGKYTFRVIAANNDGIWNETGASFDLVVRPPLWQTTAFKFFIIILFAFIIFLIFSLFLKRERLKDQLVIERIKSRELRKIDMMKFQFFTNISHEIRTPVSLIVSPLKRIIDSDLSKEQIKKDLDTVYRNAIRLGKLIDQLLDYRKIEAGKLKLELCKGDIVSYIDKVVSLFRELSRDKKVKLEFYSVVDQIQTYFDADKIEKILFNLLSNSFKHTREGGTIRVAVSLTYHLEQENKTQGFAAPGEYVQIVVKDNGSGIPAGKKEKVFERFYQAGSAGAEYNSGSGIGLNLSKELVKIHKGSITLKSEEGEGTELTILLPLIREPAEEAAKEIPENDLPLSPIITGNENGKTEEIDKDKSTLLILEDNRELLNFIKSIFLLDYNVLTAEDGQKGLDLAREKNPDIIISDILLPKLDGKKFCKMIKQDFKTSHIPVILLTALSSREHEKEGLLTGADEYIIKPFDPSLLKIKVDQLLANRVLLGEKLNHEKILESSTRTIVSPEDKFLQRLVSIIEDNISDPDFGTVRISREIGISRTKLYRKIASSTGMTVKEFIRNIRLKRASQMMVRGDLNISEVCYEVGFQQVAYFRKCFKNMYGMTPSDYIKQNSSLAVDKHQEKQNLF